MIHRDLKPEIVEPPRITPEGIVLLWRPPGGEVRLVAAPTWLRVVAVVREALADLRYQVETDVWLAVLVAAMRDAMRPRPLRR